MKIAFLFAGQGSQYVGMGKDIYDKYPSARKLLDEIKLDIDLKKLCFEGPADMLNDTAYCQAAVLGVSLAIAEVIKEKGIIPEYVAGLSLGEYSALSYAGMCDAQTACEIVRERGQIMANALPSGTTTMAAVLNIDAETINYVCSDVAEYGICEIANYNCPGQIVITGEVKAIEKASELLKERGARRVIPLNVSGAFHSSLLKDASLQLNKVLKKYDLKQPSIPVIYNVSGKPENSSVIELLTKQIRTGVHFEQTLQYLIGEGVDTFIEIGPGHTLSGFVRKTSKEVKSFNVENVTSLDKMLEAIQ